MNSTIPDTTRREIKFVAYETHRHTLLQWLHLHPAGFVSPYPDRWVNNIYFDTYDYAAFSENLSGASSRTKLRYRWYGPSIAPAAGLLEVKMKRNCFGWKRHFDVAQNPYTAGASWKKIRSMLWRQLPPEGRHWLDASPVPVLINRYFRKYFVSRDQQVRVTLDSRQSVWEQRFCAYPNFSLRALLARTCILELKFDRAAHETASHIIQGIPLRTGRHSKYVTGLRAIQYL